MLAFIEYCINRLIKSITHDKMVFMELLLISYQKVLMCPLHMEAVILILFRSSVKVLY